MHPGCILFGPMPMLICANTHLDLGPFGTSSIWAHGRLGLGLLGPSVCLHGPGSAPAHFGPDPYIPGPVGTWTRLAHLGLLPLGPFPQLALGPLWACAWFGPCRPTWTLDRFGTWTCSALAHLGCGPVSFPFRGQDQKFHALFMISISPLILFYRIVFIPLLLVSLSVFQLPYFPDPGPTVKRGWRQGTNGPLA